MNSAGAGSGAGAWLARIRECLGQVPDVTERPSHGAPAWFVRDRRQFAVLWDNHHGDGRVVLWAAVPGEMQVGLVEADPDIYFVPPYVGHRGWVGVSLDRDPPWDAVEGVVLLAYGTVEAVTPKPRPALGG